MNLEDLATKSDFNEFKEEVRKLLSPIVSKQADSSGITSQQIKKVLGIDSVSLINKMRMRGELSATKVGSIWIYNRQQVMDLVPKYKNQQ